MTTLYDAYGRPIDRGVLHEELSGPTTTGVRTPLSGHPAQGLTPERLASLLLEAEQGDATGYLELAEEMEEKDLHYRSVLATRKLQVSGLDATVDAASDAAEDVRAADLIREFLDTDVLQAALFDIMDAVGKGYSVCEILWDTEGRTWRPGRIVWRDPRWFGYDPQEWCTLRLRGETGLLEPLAPAKFISHTPQSKSGIPIRGGLARAVSWCYLFKNFDLKAWVLFAEVYGHPLRLGKYDPMANDNEKSVLLRAVRNIAADHAAIVPASMAVEFIDAQAQGNVQIFEKLAEYLDRQISKAVLGQTGTTDTGSRVGTANAHERVREDIEVSDAAQLAATLNRDLVRPLIDLNLGPRKAYPRLRIYRPDQEDLAALVDSVARLAPLGLRVESSVLADKLGLPDPDSGARCLGDVAIGTPSRPESPPSQKARASMDAKLEDDEIDMVIREELAGWELLTEPLVSPILNLADQCATAEEFLSRLAEAGRDQNPDALTRSLALAIFEARTRAERGNG